MYTKLIDHIRKNVSELSILEADMIKSHFCFSQIKNKDFFLNQGSKCKYAGFVLKGCFRNYVNSSKGKEVNTQFSFENWWIGDLGSFVNQEPAKVNIQALEDCDLLLIKANHYNKLLGASPCFMEYTHKLRSNAHLSAVLRSSNLSENANTKYEILLEKFPAIETRISQKNIASYLQISPEALSRLKAKLHLKS